MFARIMAVVLAVILLTTVCLSAVWWITLRNQQIDARLDYLISEAEEIARLAADLSGDTLMDTINDRESVTRYSVALVAVCFGLFAVYIVAYILKYKPLAIRPMYKGFCSSEILRACTGFKLAFFQIVAVCFHVVAGCGL